MLYFDYPRILIFSQPFNSFSGGGITLTNLFRDWPRENLAVISYPFMLNRISTEACNIYYQIGNEELHWKFPFSLYKPKYQSGLIDNSTRKNISVIKKKKNLRNSLADSLINPMLSWFGLSHCISSIHISSKLNKWMSEFSPDLLYFQISNRESINFAEELINYLQIPAALHMMDDWPSSISHKGIFKVYWQKKIEDEFRQLLNELDLHLSICDEMSLEYARRYGYSFISFHNTLDLIKWSPYTRKDLGLNVGTKTILFSGRIGTGIKQSLFELASAVDDLREKGDDIKLHIQTPNLDPLLCGQLQKYDSIVINPIIEYSEVPKLYSKADILVIANDFSEDGINFLKYSMPTKAPEYLISGTPILVYASSETALYKLFHSNKLGHCVPTQEQERIADAIKLLLYDKGYRNSLSKAAVAFATQNFDSNKVRYQFQNLLIETARKKKNSGKA